MVVGLRIMSTSLRISAPVDLKILSSYMTKELASSVPGLTTSRW